jgi:succinate dehydrogenase subunit C
LAPALGKQVTAMPQYSRFQPKPYRQVMSPYWYFDRWHYLKFIIRETSSVFVAYFALVMLVQIWAVSSGPTAYGNFQSWMATPFFFVVNVLALLFICFHTVTWFALVPRVMARQMLGKATPDMMVAAPNYGVWFAASLIVALFALRVI